MGKNTYQLAVKVDGRWSPVCDITAASHQEAFRKAMGQIKPEHYDKPIRLEAVKDDSDDQQMAKAFDMPMMHIPFV